MFRKIANKVLNYALNRVEKYFDKRVEDDSIFKKPLMAALDFLEELATIYTDDEPDNKEQLKELLASNKEMYISIGTGTLQIAIDKIPDDFKRESAQEALKMIEELVLKD